MDRKGNRVFIDTDIENSFLVTNKRSGQVKKFPCDLRGLYIKESSEPVTMTDCCVLTNSISEVGQFTPRKVKQARGVMKLYHDLNSPNLPSLKCWLRQNMEKNVPVSHQDVDLALKIFKSDVTTLRGK